MAELDRVRTWAEALIRLYLDDSWTFAFDNAKRRAGLCNYTTKRISVSRYLAARWSDDDVHQTLLHEVAHALAGAEAGHGPEWKKIARDMGYVGGTTHEGETATELAPWRGTCPNGHVLHRHRRPTRKTSCALCSRSYDERFAITWVHRPVTAEARRAALTPR